MADDKKDKEEAQTVANVASLELPQIIVALHEKAVSEVKDQQLTIQNSAVDGGGKKGSTFYGAGQHIIAAIPKDQKSLDKQKVKRSAAFEALKIYIQWFSGPDVVSSLKLDVLKPLDGGADGKTKDNTAAKRDIEDSKKDEVSGQKYEESLKFPSFEQYIIREASGDEAGDEASQEEEKQPKKADNPEDKAESDAADPEAEGWYVDYRVTIPGEKEHPIADALKHFAKDMLRDVGIELGGGWWAGGKKKLTVGDALDSLDAFLGKIDADKLNSEVNKELKKRMKQTDAQAQIWDTATICKYLKKETAKYKSQITSADLACCIRVTKQDKSYELFNEDSVANVVNAAIEGCGTAHGLGKMARFGIKSKDVILVNNYQDNKKASGEEAKQIAADESFNSRRVSLATLLESFPQRQPSREVKKTHVNELLAQVFGQQLLESVALLLEGHAQEWKDVLEQLDRCGLDNVKENVDQIRKSYYKHLEAAKKANPDNEYVQKILVNSKNWINRIFIGELRKLDDIEAVKKLFKDCFYQQDGRHDDTRFEMKALTDALKELPDGPKKDEKSEDGQEDEKIKIEFYDIADPSQLDDPEEPSEADWEKFKPVGEPAEIVPGEKVPAPSVENKDGYEFMGFDPDPEDMDESGKTFATYMKSEDGQEDEEDSVEPEATPDESSSDEADGADEESGEETGEEEKKDNSFQIEVVLPDQEDQENAAKQETVARITVVNGLWKPDDLEAAAEEAEKNGVVESPEIKQKREEIDKATDELNDKTASKSISSKDKRETQNKIDGLKKELAELQKKFQKSGGDPETLKSAAKTNRDEFKTVENISGLEQKKQAHGRKFDRWEPSIDELAKNGVPEGEEKAVSKAVFKGGVDVKRTPIDFYIIPMKGLRDGGDGGDSK